MRVYVTRHGQVDETAEYLNGDVSLPKKDILLSQLGQEQSTLLGKQLKALGFHGKILSSPFLRTMQTAEFSAQETGSEVVPVGWLHEILPSQEFIDSYQGYTQEELRGLFPHTAKGNDLPFPWWTQQAETEDLVYERVERGLRACMGAWYPLPEGSETGQLELGTELCDNSGEEILLVGHGASAGAVHDLLKLREGGFLWNCCLGMCDTQKPDLNYGNDVSFLPGEKVTNNGVWGMDIDFDAQMGRLYQIKLPTELRDTQAKKLLHIGDTDSITYPFYRQLIRMVKPDIIIHTGDTADEVKVGRIPGTEAEYLEKVQVLLDILEESGKKIYWISGNNDLPLEIAKRAPFIEIIDPDNVIELEGVQISVSHSREQITKEAEVYLYGHGFRAPTAEQERTGPVEGAIYLNVCWSTYVVLLPEKKFYPIPRPKLAFYENVYNKKRLI